MTKELELLAPAKDLATGMQAVLHGADAVYIGAPSHGARASAANSIDDIKQLVEFAHLYGARVYVTLNTLVYDSELQQVEHMVRRLYDIGADALIVQDMALLRLDIPPIDLHASTQCDIRTPQKARFLADCGFSQLVLPREFSLEQIRQVKEAVGDDIVLEAFVHGALCVSYSGDCQASYAACGRSANRGECAQMCRLPWSLTDADGNVLIRDRHLLSLRDLCRLGDLAAMADAGVQSFKIEGRLKDIPYVKTTVAAYRKALDRLIAENPGKYRRASTGRSEFSFVPDVNKVFNRGFTSYFLNGRPDKSVSMANIDTPKWVGEKVGTVRSVKGNTVTAVLSKPLNNGDGLGYFDSERRYSGFRVNRVDGDRLIAANAADVASLKPGTELYRNSDTKADAEMARQTATRLVDIDMHLRCVEAGEEVTLCLQLVSPTASAEVTARVEKQTARTPQAETRRRNLTKLGTTIYNAANYTDETPDDLFVPASVLSTLRRDGVEALQRAVLAAHPYRRRRECVAGDYPTDTLTYHDNVANCKAAEFYRNHGVKQIEPALETGKTPVDGNVVMTTRYCLRRELGACLLTPGANKLPHDLYLKSKNTTYRLCFDCNKCQMHLLQGGQASSLLR